MLRERLLGGRRSAWFTLQWHLTSACAAACRHCYDRSPRPALGLAAAVRVLDDLGRFCARRKVRGHVCLTGGDPLLHPDFLEVWRAAAARGFALSILGNDAPAGTVAAIAAARRPRAWQVSLEGLEAHDDAIRGPGHFRRTLAFLEVLREAGIPAHVMLTLTDDNLDDALALAGVLRGKVAWYGWNRLARAGEGAALRSVSRERYATFSRRWALAAAADSALGMKDGLLNVARWHAGRPLLGGCTGAGCGAAFDFVALLPDGEVHACRKVASPLGHLGRETLDAVWGGSAARRWRAGSAGCRGCPIRARCGGCPAVTAGEGGDPLRDRDPHCFMDDRVAALGADAR